MCAVQPLSKSKQMIQINISDQIRAAAPGLRVIQFEADVRNQLTSDALWQVLLDEEAAVKLTYAISDIAHRPGIAATRSAYKALGKEPNRYRPSAEALCRRAVQGKGLYRITTLVDIINILSMRSGYSIGGFDRDKIIGETLTLGVGMNGEPFQAIGRGQLNIEFLPVYRDAAGSIGTPTSDADRTKLTDDTTRLLMTVNVYGEEMSDEDFIGLANQLLTDYASAENIKIQTIR